MLLQDYSIKKLERAYKKESDVNVRERLQIILYLREGYTQREVSSLLRVSVGKVPFWKKRFEHEGFASLVDKEGRGMKAQLTDENLSSIASALCEGILMDDGYRRPWKTKDAVMFINSNFEVQFTRRHCRRILRDMSCTIKVPRPRNKRRNQENVNDFKEAFQKKEASWVMT